MAQAARDQNRVTVLMGVSDADGTTLLPVKIDHTTNRIMCSATGVGAGTVTSVSVVSANGFAGTVATATTTPAITLTTTVTGILSGNGTAISAASTTGSGSVVLATTPTITTPVLNGTITGTGVSQSVSTLTLVQRDGNSNAFANNFVSNSASTVSSGGTTALTVASARLQILTGAANQTYTLPNATTMNLGGTFEFNNNSTGTLTIQDNAAGAVTSIASGGYARIVVTNTGSAAGTWDKHFLIPANGVWTTAGATVTGTLQATGHVTFEGVTSTGATGTGNLVFSASPTFTGTVVIPTPFTLGATSVTTTGTQLNYLNAATGTTGTTSTNVVFSTSPTLVTPTLGVASATSINKVAITAPATSATLTIADGKTLTASNTLTLAGTDATTMTFPTTSASIARTDAGQTFTGVQSMTSPDITTSITTPSTTFSIANATATTLNIGGAATTFNMAGGSAAAVNVGGGASAAELRLLEPSGSGTNYTGFKAQAMAANLVYTLPAAQGAASTFLQNDGSGGLTWAAAAAGGAGKTFFTCAFETSTRYNLATGGSGTNTFDTNGLNQTTGATGTSYAKAQAFLDGSGNMELFARNPSFSAIVTVTAAGTTNGVGGTIWMGNAGVDGTTLSLTTAHIGFKIVRSGGVLNLYATQADGTTETASSSLTTLVANDTVDLYCTSTSGTSTDYYWRKNGGALSSATTLSTNMPSSTTVVRHLTVAMSNVANAETFTMTCSGLRYERSGA